MECERLKKLVKNWYMQVQDESMAPARMVDFMNQHLEDCATCMGDPGVDIEVKRITEIVLPPAKIPKAVRKATNQKEETSDSVENSKTEVNDDVDENEDATAPDKGEDDVDPDDNEDATDPDEGEDDDEDEI